MSAVLDTVYNNYLTTYTPKSITRYDTHKKSELRSVYNSIVKLNNDSPWYLPTKSKETQYYAVDLKENARELHNTIAGLGGLEESGMLNQKSASSSNEDVVTALYIGPQNTDGPDPHFNIEVRQLATPQENLGLFLPNSHIALPSDTYSFDISINDMDYEFQFSVDESETNRDVQERLTRLINNANIGLNASIEEAEGERTSIRLVSDATGNPMGKEFIFNISDNNTSKASGTVEYFGLDYVSHEPTNAIFLINGEDRSASTNHFTVAKLFEIKLNGLSPEGEPATIGLKADLDSLTDNVTTLVNGYNSFIKAVSSYMDTQSKSRTLVKEMHGIADLYQDAMSRSGLNMQEDGTLEVDKDTMKQTARDAEDAFKEFEFMKDFSNMLLRKTNQISLDPMQYVNKTVVAYKNPGRSFTSPYTSSTYSGMMFNYYC